MKSKLGISVCLLGAAAYLCSLFAGYTATLLLTGYILLFEQNAWLKQTAVKAFAVSMCFSLLSAFVGFIPNILSLVYSIGGIFGSVLYSEPVYSLVDAVQQVISIVQKVVLLVLMFKALKHETIRINIVDSLMEKEFGSAATRSETAESRFCDNCGKNIAASAVFCPHCGQRG